MKCVWKGDYLQGFFTSCGESFSIAIEMRKFRYCCFCGKEIEYEFNGRAIPLYRKEVKLPKPSDKIVNEWYREKVIKTANTQLPSDTDFISAEEMYNRCCMSIEDYKEVIKIYFDKELWFNRKGGREYYNFSSFASNIESIIPLLEEKRKSFNNKELFEKMKEDGTL